jgi:hypothetical protein
MVHSTAWSVTEKMQLSRAMSRILVEMLTVTQLDKKFLAFYGN